MNITLTDSAKVELKKNFDANQYMKIDLLRSGCCGYSLDLAPGRRKDDDHIIEADEFEIAVSDKAFAMMKDIQIDHRRLMLKKGYFITPM